jgi:hypothetical protein
MCKQLSNWESASDFALSKKNIFISLALMNISTNASLQAGREFARIAKDQWRVANTEILHE